jgi:hypothetical protein
MEEFAGFRGHTRPRQAYFVLKIQNISSLVGNKSQDV